MYISDCLAYENIEVKVEAVEDHINLAVRSVKHDYAVSLTLSGPQVATIAVTLIETLTALGEIEDKLGIFGIALKVGAPILRTRKEAA